jgi:hypothetical protein
VAIVVAVAAMAARGETADFTRQPPAAIFGFASWPSVSGEVRSDALSFGYRFHVNPDRPALYSVMRYRLREPPGGAPFTEKFLWVERPGARTPIRCFELSLGDGARWRELTPGTDEYLREMGTLMAVLGHQNQDARRRARAEP